MAPIPVSLANFTDCHECACLLAEQLGEHGVDTSIERLTRVLEKLATDGIRGFVLLARDDSKVVGVAYVATILSVEHCGLVAWLEELYVTPSHRARGIGTALLSAVVDRARAAGIVAIDLEVDAGHRRAESLYRRFGFSTLERSRWVREF